MAKEAERKYSVELELQQLFSVLEKHKKEEDATKTGERHAGFIIRSNRFT